MAAKTHLNLMTFITLITFLLTLSNSISTSQHPDLKPLMAFKSSTSDPNNTLSSWTNTNATTNPCSSNWFGVTCINNRVSHIVLEGLGLHGSPLAPLTSLSTLRVLSLKHNHLSGTLPTNLSSLISLNLLFLSHNSLSGPLPLSLPSHLYRLDLSFNNLSAHLPLSALNSLPHLLTLLLQSNLFTGQIYPLNLPNLQDFNISNNLVDGPIPKSLSNFPISSFTNTNNHHIILCGTPLPGCKQLIVSNPSRNPTLSISSSPTSNPSSAAPTRGKKMSSAAIMGIVAGDVVVVGLMLVLVFGYFYRQGKKGAVGKTVGRQLVESEKIVYSMRSNNNEGGFQRGKMVFFEGEKRFELEDLLRASAEMLGKGGFGTAYKAVLDDGNVVAVKRLKEVNGGTGSGGKREFEQVMETLGRLRHPNVVCLKAYYFARDERLLVFDYMANGSLYWLLHGNRGPGRTPLDWTTRMKIASGMAHGLAYIHHYCINRTTNKLCHGNIKSTNVLLDKIYNPRLSDWGLNTLFASSPTTTNSTARPPNGYRAPEALEGRKYSHQKADVYAFGVLLLEILTGKCPLVVDSHGVSSRGAVLDLPRWVQSVVREEWTAEVFDLELMRYKDIEEEMVGLLQIAMACTCVNPDQRPRIGSVLRMIEEIRGVEVSPSYESFDSDSPSVSEYTDG